MTAGIDASLLLGASQKTTNKPVVSANLTHLHSYRLEKALHVHDGHDMVVLRPENGTVADDAAQRRLCEARVSDVHTVGRRERAVPQTALTHLSPNDPVRTSTLGSFSSLRINPCVGPTAICTRARASKQEHTHAHTQTTGIGALSWGKKVTHSGAVLFVLPKGQTGAEKNPPPWEHHLRCTVAPRIHFPLEVQDMAQHWAASFCTIRCHGIRS